MPASIPSAALTEQSTGRGAWSVFLSSTIDDLDDMRTEVVDVLQKFGAACDDCRNWVGGFEDVQTLCKRQLQQANGYLLLLGHWYGSVQVPGGPSVTQIEFECALERWKDIQPPYIAVMVPKLNSPADTMLQQRAEAIVARRQLDTASHATQIRGFRERVTGTWRKVNFFSDAQELREYALVVCTTWRSGGFKAAALAQADAATELEEVLKPEERDLGMLGRGTQIEALRQALSELKLGPYPALALLVHGNDEAGQRAFMAHLAGAPLRAFKPGRSSMRLPHTCLGLAELCAWMAQSMGLPTVAEHTPTSVAHRVADRLRDERPLCLMLDGVGAFEGGAVQFHAQFWQPFFEQLCALHAALPFKYRMIVVLSDYAGQAEAFAAVARSVDDEATTATASLLLALPELGQFTQAQVKRWLTDMAYADEPPGHLAAVMRRAVTNDRGDPDLIPMKVLDRLRFEPLSPMEDPL